MYHYAERWPKGRGLMVKKIKTFKLNKNVKLVLEVVNELDWTKCFIKGKNVSLYIGSEVYSYIKERFDKNFKSNNLNEPVVEYDNNKIYRIITLSDPYITLYKTVNGNKLLIQNEHVEFVKEIDLEIDNLDL